MAAALPGGDSSAKEEDTGAGTKPAEVRNVSWDVRGGIAMRERIRGAWYDSKNKITTTDACRGTISSHGVPIDRIL